MSCWRPSPSSHRRCADREKLLGLLLAQPPDTLRKERATFVEAIDTASSPPLVLRGAYGAIMIADGKPDEAWQTALKHQAHLVELLLSVRAIFRQGQLGRGCLARSALRQSPDSRDKRGTAHSTAALDALGWIRGDAATFDLLAKEVKPDAEPASRAAAIASLQRIPDSAWPAASIEPLARAIVAIVAGTPEIGGLILMR